MLVKNGGKNATQRTNETWKRGLREYEALLLDSALDKSLQTLWRNARKASPDLKFDERSNCPFWYLVVVSVFQYGSTHYDTCCRWQALLEFVQCAAQLSYFPRTLFPRYWI